MASSSIGAAENRDEVMAAAPGGGPGNTRHVTGTRMYMLELSLGAGKRSRRPALLWGLCLFRQRGRAAGERQESKNDDKSPTHQAPHPMAFGQLDHEGMAGQ